MMKYPKYSLGLALSFFISLFSGCGSDSGTGAAVGTGPQFETGHYFIQSDVDDLYHFDQYFVALPDYHWEFVEYGYALGHPDNLCQVTRQSGSYNLTDTALTLVFEKSSDSFEKCGMTKTDFQQITLIPISGPNNKGTIKIRNRSSVGFEGFNFFINKQQWDSFLKKPDPYGFY